MLFIYPMAVMVFYILALGLLNFRTRFHGVKSGQVKLSYYKVYEDKTNSAPEFLVRMGRHYDNQFELPMLFFITCTVGLVLHVSNLFAVLAAWMFVISRMVHTYHHLGSNNVLKRAGWFFLGWVCIAIMWIVILVTASMQRSFNVNF